MVGSRSVGGGGQLRSPRAYYSSAAQMMAHALDEFAGKGDPFVEVLGVERLNEGIWVEGLSTSEKSEDPAVFGPEAELQDRFGRRLHRIQPPLFAEGCCFDDAEGGLPALERASACCPVWDARTASLWSVLERSWSSRMVVMVSLSTLGDMLP